MKRLLKLVQMLLFFLLLSNCDKFCDEEENKNTEVCRVLYKTEKTDCSLTENKDKEVCRSELAQSETMTQSTDNQINELNAAMTLWKNNVHKGGKYWVKKKDDQSNELGDMVLFNALACYSGETEQCDYIKESQFNEEGTTNHGRWMREPNKTTTFSRDMTLGVLLWALTTKDNTETKEALKKWREWIVNAGTLPALSQSCQTAKNEFLANGETLIESLVKEKIEKGITSVADSLCSIEFHVVCYDVDSDNIDRQENGAYVSKDSCALTPNIAFLMNEVFESFDIEKIDFFGDVKVSDILKPNGILTQSIIDDISETASDLLKNIVEGTFIPFINRTDPGYELHLHAVNILVKILLGKDKGNYKEAALAIKVKDTTGIGIDGFSENPFFNFVYNKTRGEILNNEKDVSLILKSCPKTQENIDALESRSQWLWERSNLERSTMYYKDAMLASCITLRNLISPKK